jgi:hypothetical protein
MDRLSEIRARYTPGNTQFRDVGKCTINDIHYLLAEIERLRGEVGRLIDLAGNWKEAADQYHAGRNQLREENRWISVSEMLPKKPPDYFKDGHWWMVSGEDFIVADSDGKVYEAHWTYGCSCQNYFWYVNSLTPLTNITHWRPLPEPPKGE